MEYSNRRQALKRRRARARRRRMIILIALILAVVILVVTAIVLIVKAIQGGKGDDVNETPVQTEQTEDETGETGETDEPSTPVDNVFYNPESYHVDPNTPANFQVTPKWESTIELTGDKVLDYAESVAAGYDYDKAIEYLQSQPNYASNTTYQQAVARYEETKGTMVKWADNTQITHIFFHTLVVDVDTAFSSYKKDAYNQVMTTVQEFCDIMEEMYARGYVLVSIYDIAKIEVQPDGTEKMVQQEIWLPEGKIPFVLSQDDVSYYEYMTGTGFANRLVIGEDGRVTNEMDLADGTTLTGSYDMIPILEDFIAAHPDFSYQGARGIIALTGYDGIFGYRTSDFWYNPNCDYFIANDKNIRDREVEHSFPNNNIEADKQTAKEVAQALRNQGWDFASHSWGHRKYGEMDESAMRWDADIWEKEVEPLIGETDILIFPTGNDIGSWRGYEADNTRYTYLKSLGFDYYCNVDSAVTWVQFGDQYMRQGRRNLDGTRMWQALNGNDKLSDLFDSSLIFDPKRPTPVP